MRTKNKGKRFVILEADGLFFAYDRAQRRAISRLLPKREAVAAVRKRNSHKWESTN